ncbi:MAG: hypothetical protein IT495_17245 [Gammaproteobacteria bacterium]|nr:hypothetical protein [Gammaproteobacteria bacterium]
MSASSRVAPVQARTREPVYVFGTSVAGQHNHDSAAVALRHHGAAADKWNGPTGDAYAIPYRNSEGELLSPAVIANYLRQLFDHARQCPDRVFLVARFGCERGAFDDDAMARLFAGAPGNCLLPGVWLRKRRAPGPVRLIVFDPSAQVRTPDRQARIRTFIDINTPLWGASTVEIVSTGPARTIAANDELAKTLGFKHRVTKVNTDYYGEHAAVAAEARAVWYATHLLSVRDLDRTAQPNQIRMISVATRNGLHIEQIDSDDAD